jgi:hypothetical protein
MRPLMKLTVVRVKLAIVVPDGSRLSSSLIE